MPWENVTACRSTVCWAARTGGRSISWAGWDLISDRKIIGKRAGQLKHDGFRKFKIKIGGKDRKQDVARVGAVREAVGAEATIRVDGNAAYSFTESREMLTELSRFHIADAEQPLARGDLKSLAELRRTVGIPIAAQESVSSPEDALEVLEEQAADLLKIELTHIGGFQRGIQVAAIMGAKDFR